MIGTMHTSDAATTLNRLLDVFPAAQQTQIRASVAESLRGIVCQRLLPAPGTAASSWRARSSSTTWPSRTSSARARRRACSNTMETGVREGMCLMDNVIFSLCQEGKVSKETALASISNRVLRAKIT